jgi:hypothetical protein
MKVIIFLRANASQAEHTIGFKAVRQIRPISGTKQLFAPVQLIRFSPKQLLKHAFHNPIYVFCNQ